MTEETKKTEDFVNVTDCLEAVSVLKSIKNFLFILILISIIALGFCFWFADMGFIYTQSQADQAQQAAQERFVEQIETEVVLPADPNSTEQAVASAAEKVADEQTTKVLTAPKSKPELAIHYKYVRWVVKFCNYLLFFGAILYALALLISLKISLVGNLGGINHITRAFFLSLFMVIFLMPWQKIFGPTEPVVVGTIYLLSELLHVIEHRQDFGTLEVIFHYIRFVGWPMIILLLLFGSLTRSSRWARATLRRLGID